MDTHLETEPLRADPLQRFAGKAALLAAVTVHCWACTSSPSPASVAPLTVIPPVPAETKTTQSTDQTTLLLEESWEQTIPNARWPKLAFSPHSGLWSAFELEEPSRVGDHALTPNGETDIFLLRHGDSGVVENVVHLGGPGDEDLEDIAVGEELVWLALKTDGKIELAGEEREPPPPAKDAIVLPTIGVAVAMSAKGRIVRSMSLPDAAVLRIQPAPGAGLFVASGHITESYLGAAHLSLRQPSGLMVWSRSWLGAHPAEMVWDAATKTLLVSLRFNTHLAVVRIDPASGKTLRKVSVDKIHGAGDLGSIEGIVPMGDSAVAYGYTGGPVEVNREVHEHSSSIRPFSVTVDATPRFFELTDAIGHVIAAGQLDSKPAVLFSVIHPGSDESMHRGAYLRVGMGRDQTVFPLHQVRYARDDWEHEPPEVVLGNPMTATDAAFHERDVFAAGVIPTGARIVGLSLTEGRTSHD